VKVGAMRAPRRIALACQGVRRIRRLVGAACLTLPCAALRCLIYSDLDRDIATMNVGLGEETNLRYE
jgi:hypothetical protein